MKALTILGSIALLSGDSFGVTAGRSLTIHAVAYSPDGKFLVTAGICRPIVLRDAATGKEVRRLAERSSWEGNAVFLPDGEHILATERGDKAFDDTVVLLPVSGSGEHVVVGKMPKSAWITQLAMSKDGKTLAAVAGSNPVVVWDVASRRELRRFEAGDFGMGVALSPDGKTLAWTGLNGNKESPHLWEADTGKALASPTSPCDCVACSPDGQSFAFGNRNAVLLWDSKAARETATLKLGAHAMAFSADGKSLAAGNGRTISLWDLSKRERSSSLEAAGTVTSLAFNPDGKSIAAAHYEPGGLQIWSLPDGKELANLALPPNETK